MSALPPKADIDGRQFDVCFVPEADMRLSLWPRLSARRARPGDDRESARQTNKGLCRAHSVATGHFLPAPLIQCKP
jgi:hypothetical protein